VRHGYQVQCNVIIAPDSCLFFFSICFGAVADFTASSGGFKIRDLDGNLNKDLGSTGSVLDCRRR
jgi:hypothetical protein